MFAKNCFLKNISCFILILSFYGCIPPSLQTKPAAEAVALPANITSVKCKNLQSKYYDSLKTFAKTIPFPMSIGQMGFVEYKDSLYFSIDFVGSVYNTIRTTLTSRLSGEFFGKYQKCVKLTIDQAFLKEVTGLRIALHCSSTNFVSDPYYHNQENENLEIFSPKHIVREFILGDISGQDLIDKSIVFINGQRTKFTLQMM